MQEIRKTAMFAVGRAVFFGGFAISMVMLAFSFDFLLAFRAGAILSIGMAAILLWFAQTGSGRKPERLETWILLSAEARPRDEAARRQFLRVMHDVYLYYAARAFAFGVGFLAIAIVLSLSGLEIGLK